MPFIGLYVLAPSIHSLFYVIAALLKSDVSGTEKNKDPLPEFWTYKDGTRFILKRNELSIR